MRHPWKSPAKLHVGDLVCRCCCILKSAPPSERNAPQLRLSERDRQTLLSTRSDSIKIFAATNKTSTSILVSLHAIISLPREMKTKNLMRRRFYCVYDFRIFEADRPKSFCDEYGGRKRTNNILVEEVYFIDPPSLKNTVLLG